MAGPLPPTPRCPPGWQRRRWPLAVRVSAPMLLRTQQRDGSRMHVVAPCLARPGRTRAVSSPRGTYTSHLPHGNGPGGGQGETRPWTSLHTRASLRRADGARPPLNAPFPASVPAAPDGPADTECSVCHAHMRRPVWNDPGVGGRGQVCLSLTPGVTGVLVCVLGPLLHDWALSHSPLTLEAGLPPPGA